MRTKLLSYLEILFTKNINGGETGIRTQERVAPLPVFKTGAFNRSAISPLVIVYNDNNLIQPKKRVIFFQDFALSDGFVLQIPRILR